MVKRYIDVRGPAVTSQHSRLPFLVSTVPIRCIRCTKQTHFGGFCLTAGPALGPHQGSMLPGRADPTAVLEGPGSSCTEIIWFNYNYGTCLSINCECLNSLKQAEGSPCCVCSQCCWKSCWHLSCMAQNCGSNTKLGPFQSTNIPIKDPEDLLHGRGRPVGDTSKQSLSEQTFPSRSRASVQSQCTHGMRSALHSACSHPQVPPGPPHPQCAQLYCRSSYLPRIICFLPWSSLYSEQLLSFNKPLVKAFSLL